MLDKKKIIADMEKRMEALRSMNERDFGGSLTGINDAFREVKYWKEAIERNIYNVRTWGDDE